MAILFNGTSDYLSLAAAPATAAPMTMAAWVQPGAQVAGERCVITISASGATAQYFTLDDGTGAGAPSAWIASTTSASASAGVRTGSGAWSHIAGVYVSATSRSAYVNGGWVGSNATNLTPTGQNQSIIGAFKQGGNATSTFFGGLLADVAIWNVALTVGELAALAKGARPWEIRPSGLVACVSGDRSVTYDLQGRIWTLNGAPKLSAEMPPLVIPRPQLRARLRGFQAAAGPISGVVDATIDPFTLASTATLKLQAALNSTIANFTLSATGTVKLQAALAATIDPFTLASTGTLKVQGALAATIDPFTLVSTSTLKLQAALNATVPNFTLASTGVLPIQGTLGATIPNFTLAATGALKLQASLSATIDPFTLAATGALIVKGALASTIDSFTLSATGTLPIQGALNATIDNFTLSATGVQPTYPGLIKVPARPGPFRVAARQAIRVPARRSTFTVPRR